METSEEKITCPGCREDFLLTEHNPNGVGGERERYSCPYSGCNFSAKQYTPGSFSTSIDTEGTN
tara:strand:+ start:1160 stop:1351 length:192 start_codon:yes stop_codon:yes gene_type:complete